MTPPILELNHISLGFKSPGEILTIVSDVSLSINEGEWYGLVGESGCGKSLTALGILGLLPKPFGMMIEGSICYQGTEVLSPNISGHGTSKINPLMQKLRGRDISMIFQEPMSALNPLYTIEKQLLECFAYHQTQYTSPQDRMAEVLKQVGLGSSILRVLKSYPHELSGGMQQRVMIAMALMLSPKLLIADEPTTALDVTIQAQIMELLKELQGEYGLSILFITHNLALMTAYADRVGVMYAGKLVEELAACDFVTKAMHPYTQGLLKAVPSKQGSIPIPGRVPSPRQYSKGCRFEPRCNRAFEKCNLAPPLYKEDASHQVLCWLPSELSIHHSTGEP